jgi:ATP-dependent DNA helicase DinG
MSWIKDAIRPKDAPREEGVVDAIHWIQAKENRNVHSYSWESRHLDLSGVLRWSVWMPTRSVIACSATMTTSTGTSGWSWIRRQLGYPEDTETLTVPSPFDFAKRALLCLPEGMPNPQTERESYDQAVCEIVGELADAAGGRTLGLFTSTRMATEAAAYLRGREAKSGYAVLAQGEGPRSMLIDKFRSDETLVLLGTTSLWTGVDVPGHASIVVVIDKIPFAPPGDPVIDALCERAVARTGKLIAGFYEEILPRATLKIKQGAGRLIRSQECWGTLVVCDPRLLSKPYGAAVIKSLGMTTRTRSVGETCRWLEQSVALMIHSAAASGDR